MFSSLRVLDLSSGMAGAVCSRLLLDSGVTVERHAPPGDAAFSAAYPAYKFWRDGSVAVSTDDLETHLATVDVILMGGEDWPGVTPRRDAVEVAEAHPDAVVVDLTAYSDGSSLTGPAVDSLVQAATGMGAEQLDGRPFRFAVPMPTYGQVLVAMVGMWSALIERVASARGQRVVASLETGAAYFMMPFWMKAERPDATFNKVTPRGTKHLIFECADGGYVQFVMGVPSAVRKLYSILAIDEVVDAADRGFPRPGAGPDHYFGNRPLIAEHVARMRRDDILAAAARVGIPAAPVLDVGEFWDDPQIAATGLLGHYAGVEGVVNALGGRSTAGATDAGWKPQPDRLLDGLTVVDFGSFVAGPFASRLLGDLGARIIKVETPAGDPGRGTMRHFISCQSGKESIALDLKHPEGRAVLHRLLETADVVTHNFRAGVDERIGLAPEQVREINPAVIVLRSTAFGITGPRAKDPGFDMVAQALVGLEQRAGGPGQEPVWMISPYLDYACGGLGAITVLMSLYAKVADGGPLTGTLGTVSDAWVSLLHTGMLLNSDAVRASDGSMRLPAPVDADHLGCGPADRYLPTADGWIAVAALDAAQRATLWTTVTADRPVPTEPWTGGDVERLEQAVRVQSSAHWLEALSAAGVWAAAQIEAAVPATSRDDEIFGQVHGHLTSLAKFDRTPQRQHGALGAPQLGQHTRSVLASIGYAEQDIDELIRHGVVLEPRRSERESA